MPQKRIVVRLHHHENGDVSMVWLQELCDGAASSMDVTGLSLSDVLMCAFGLELHEAKHAAEEIQQSGSATVEVNSGELPKPVTPDYAQ
jgi:hypothetical protein